MVNTQVAVDIIVIRQVHQEDHTVMIVGEVAIVEVVITIDIVIDLEIDHVIDQEIDLVPKKINIKKCNL